MSPSETTTQSGLLEHPDEAFAYYRHEGVPKVVCEQKHMGSRAVVIVCCDEAAARKRFGVAGEGSGIIYTRTGRRFFEDRVLEAELLDRVRAALSASGFWDEWRTDWVCLDAELMPWSVKAHTLLRDQYAAVGAAARTALPEVVACLQQAGARGVEVAELLARAEERQSLIGRYVEAYQRYCWPVNSVTEYTAPEHLDRLRSRGLSAKRSLAIREFALGLEALERFVRREPLRRVHECVFGVLALESEPVDPRL